MKTLSRLLTAVTGALALALALGATTSPVRYAFSHAEHAGRDPASTCIDCHALELTWPSGTTAAGRPSLRTARCAHCHDDVPAVAPRGEPQSLAVVFDHRPHATAVATQCTLCHARTATADGRRPEHRLIATSAVCLGCHASSGEAPREQACARCHGRDERQVEPASHTTPTWRKGHGPSASPFAPLPHGQSCVLCHRESTCKTCHRVEKPESHTALWATRTHGVSASFDRARCKTCHETGQCIGCHRNTEPPNHRGAWKSTHGLVARGRTDTSCQVCHKASYCIDCHRGGP